MKSMAMVRVCHKNNSVKTNDIKNLPYESMILSGASCGGFLLCVLQHSLQHKKTNQKFTFLLITPESIVV